MITEHAVSPRRFARSPYARVTLPNKDSLRKEAKAMRAYCRKGGSRPVPSLTKLEEAIVYACGFSSIAAYTQHLSEAEPNSLANLGVRELQIFSSLYRTRAASYLGIWKAPELKCLTARLQVSPAKLEQLPPLSPGVLGRVRGLVDDEGSMVRANMSAETPMGDDYDPALVLRFLQQSVGFAPDSTARLNLGHLVAGHLKNFSEQSADVFTQFYESRQDLPERVRLLEGLNRLALKTTPGHLKSLMRSLRRTCRPLYFAIDSLPLSSEGEVDCYAESAGLIYAWRCFKNNQTLNLEEFVPQFAMSLMAIQPNEMVPEKVQSGSSSKSSLFNKNGGYQVGTPVPLKARQFFLVAEKPVYRDILDRTWQDNTLVLGDTGSGKGHILLHRLVPLLRQGQGGLIVDTLDAPQLIWFIRDLMEHADRSEDLVYLNPVTGQGVEHFQTNVDSFLSYLKDGPIPPEGIDYPLIEGYFKHSGLACLEYLMTSLKTQSCEVVADVICSQMKSNNTLAWRTRKGESFTRIGPDPDCARYLKEQAVLLADFIDRIRLSPMFPSTFSARDWDRLVACGKVILLAQPRPSINTAYESQVAQSYNDSITGYVRSLSHSCCDGFMAITELTPKMTLEESLFQKGENFCTFLILAQPGPHVSKWLSTMSPIDRIILPANWDMAGQLSMEEEWRQIQPSMCAKPRMGRFFHITRNGVEKWDSPVSAGPVFKQVCKPRKMRIKAA